MCCTPAKFFLGVLAILFPPLPVWIERSLCSADSLINIALCVLGYFPGLLHSWYIISITPSDTEYYASDNDPIIYTERHSYHRVPQGDIESNAANSSNSNNIDANNENVSYYYVNMPAPNSTSQRNYGTLPATQQSSGTRGPDGEQLHGEVPPTYNEATRNERVVQGDNKVQRT